MSSLAAAIDTDDETALDIDLHNDQARLHELLGRAKALCAHIAAQQAALAAVTADIVELTARIGPGWGFRSDRHLLTFELGLPPRTVTKLLTVASTRRKLPALAAACDTGVLGLDLAAAVASVATPATDGHFADLARVSTASQLTQICSTYRQLRPTKEPPARKLSLTSDGTGWELRGWLDADDGALLEQTLAHTRDRLLRQHRTPASNADALMHIVSNHDGDGGGGASGADRRLAVFTIDADAYLAGEPDAATVAGGPAVPDDVLQRILEDISTVVVVNRDGRPAWISDMARTPPPWMRRLIRIRDGDACAFPDCGSRGYREHHHVAGYTAQPAATADEIITLCGFHHRSLHNDGGTISANGDGTFAFRRPDGTVVAPRPPAPVPLTPPPPLPERAPHSPLTHWALDCTIGHLLRLDEPTDTT